MIIDVHRDCSTFVLCRLQSKLSAITQVSKDVSQTINSARTTSERGGQQRPLLPSIPLRAAH